MKNSKLHIISFTVPWPPDYGGAMDIFYKIKALHALGVEIILHCFVYNRPESRVLEKYCSKVYYYKRQNGFLKHLCFNPYIVSSRKNRSLLDNLLKDNYPVLFEGVHTTVFLNHPRLRGRNMWIRAHNVEHRYYYSLGKIEKPVFSKLYFYLEAWKLKRYEKKLSDAKGILAISENDASFFRNINARTHVITAFHGHSSVTSIPGGGEYMLFHGDLSVAENNCSAERMLALCAGKHFPLVIAGKNPSPGLVKKAISVPSCKLISNPGDETMKKLIQEAAGILLPAKQTTGLRLKLLVSLFMGRYCIVSPQMVEGTGLDPLCIVSETEDEWVDAISGCLKKPFNEEEIKKRQQLLKPFLDEVNGKRMVEVIGSVNP